MTMPPPPPPGFRAPPAPPPASPTPTAAPLVLIPTEPRARNGGAAFMAVIATALIVTAVFLGWLDRTVLPTAEFVATGTSAASAPAVVDQIEQRLSASLSPQLSALVFDAAGTPTEGSDPNAFDAALNASIDVVTASPLTTVQWDLGLTATHRRSLEIIAGAVPTQAELDGTTLSVDLNPLALAVRDQLGANGYPSVAGATVTVEPLVATTSASVAGQPAIADAAGRWWVALLLGLVATVIAYVLSTRRPRLTLLLGADIIVGAGAVWLLARLLANVAGDRGLTVPDQQVLSALYEPFGASLRTSAIITAVIGGIVVVAAFIMLSVQASSDRRVRSATRNPLSSSEAL